MGPVGKMGSLLHKVTNNHSLPAMLKERYGGLKRLLQRHEDVFLIGADHPYNPHVYLRSEGIPQQAAKSVKKKGKQKLDSGMSPRTGTRSSPRRKLVPGSPSSPS